MSAPYHQFDEALRRVLMTPGPAVTGRQAARLIVELVNVLFDAGISLHQPPERYTQI